MGKAAARGLLEVDMAHAYSNRPPAGGTQNYPLFGFFAADHRQVCAHRHRHRSLPSTWIVAFARIGTSQTIPVENLWARQMKSRRRYLLLPALWRESPPEIEICVLGHGSNSSACDDSCGYLALGVEEPYLSYAAGAHTAVSLRSVRQPSSHERKPACRPRKKRKPHDGRGDKPKLQIRVKRA